MPKNPPATNSTYRALLKSIKSEIESSRRFIEQRRVLTYWAVGRLIEEFLSSGVAGGAGLHQRLAADLDIDQRTLYQAGQFFRAYPDLDARRPISWSHYRYLIMLPDAKIRRQWERRIIKEGLGVHDLRAALQAERLALTVSTGREARLEVVRGVPYHYRLIKVNDLAGKREGVLVDCGFAISIEPPPARRPLVNKRIVRSIKTEEGYALRLSKVTADKIFTYAARVERVIDGDTLLAQIDCGFGIYTRQRLRLRGIDAPELKTDAGLRAKRYVEECLSACPFVIIRTHKSDKYDRYLADVFYQPRAAAVNAAARDGDYLNQELLDRGHAGLWK